MSGKDVQSPIQQNQVDSHLSTEGDDILFDGNENFLRWSWKIPAKNLSLETFLSTILENILSSEAAAWSPTENIYPRWFFLERSPFLPSVKGEGENTEKNLRQAVLAFGPCLLGPLSFEERAKREAELRHSPFHELSLPIFSDQRDFYHNQQDLNEADYSGNKSVMVPRIALVAQFKPCEGTDHFQLDSWEWVIQSLSQNSLSWNECKPEVLRHLHFVDKLFSNSSSIPKTNPTSNQEAQFSLQELNSFKVDLGFNIQQNPSFLDWNKTIELFKEHFALEEKIVLCRQVCWQMNKLQRQTYKQYLAHIICQSLCTKSFANFFIQINKQESHEGSDHISYFISLSPEQLFQYRPHQMQVDVIAGTRPRGKNESEDACLKQELLQNTKEIFEHQVVLETLTQQLNQLGIKPELKFKEQIVPLSHVQHLYSSLQMAFNNMEQPLLLNQLHLENLISLFHPTPAVGGRPKIKALNFLKQNNRAFELGRGHFAAPIFLNLPSMKVAMVAIRTCEMKETNAGAEVRLKAGAGIVHDSTAKAEWIETLRKMKNFLPQALFEQLLLQAKDLESSIGQQLPDFQFKSQNGNSDNLEKGRNSL